MRVSLVFLALISCVLLISGCIGLPPKTDFDAQQEPQPKVDAIIGCVEDVECAYAINAYSSPHCVSGNCPPEDQTQPEPNAPGYTWEDGFSGGCINIAANEGKDARGEAFQLNPRIVCACVAILNTTEKRCQEQQ